MCIVFKINLLWVLIPAVFFINIELYYANCTDRLGNWINILKTCLNFMTNSNLFLEVFF